ncbi:MAG: LysR family transcriptional regulator [Firmicutes bacterium]|nr:LysR family transcriptional regulator [Bacillota bacterium]
MNLTYLKYFIEVCRCGSIQGASKKLFISSQGLGQGIQRLERSVGIQLLERRRSGVRPTKFGLKFYEQASIACKELQKLDQLVEDYKHTKKTNIIIGTVGRSKFFDGITVCAEDYMREHPEQLLNIGVRSYQNDEELLAGVRSGEIDIGLMYHWQEYADLKYYPVSCYSRLILLTSADNPLAGQNSVGWEQLKSLRFVTAGEKDSFSALVKGLCESHGFPPRNAYYSTENNMIASLVDNNSASIILRESYHRVISRFCNNARVIPIVPEVSVASSLFIKAANRHNNKIQELLSYMVDYFKNTMGMSVSYN